MTYPGKLAPKCPFCSRTPPDHGRFCRLASRVEHVTVDCPECGVVRVAADHFHAGLLASAPCTGGCHGRLYFDEHPASQILLRSQM